MNNISYEKEADDKEYFYYHLSNNNVCAPHFHNNLEIVIMLKGQQGITINGNTRVLNVGDIAISNSFDVHYYNTVGVSQMHIFVLGDAYCRRFFKLYGKVFPNFLEYNKDTFDELQRVCSLIDNASPYKYTNLMKYGIADMIFGVLVKYYPLLEPKKSNTSEIVKILTYIDKNYNLNLTLELLSFQFGYVKNYFSNLFNKYMGMHLRDYINMIRIEKVKALSEKDKDGTITQIAMLCGFESMNTFYRAWKKFNNGFIKTLA